MSAVTDILLAPDVRPFAIAAAIMAALGGLEALTMIVGFSISELIGADFALEAEHDSAIGGLFLWINAGRVPLLILIILVLGVFAIAGFFLQGIAHIAGTAIPVALAALFAAALSLPAVRVASRGIARIIPRDETYAVNDADFVGKVAEVAIGPLDQGLPGRVRLKDVFGNWHSVPARASADSNPLPVGASVLLVDRDSKSFIAISAPEDLAPQQPSRRA
ncbi:OB-fold-containig protein [Bradyrhizobium sp.]|uniref:OB-fold-containig protein n=1 Tax=Bradyrhizobium sp. TaxID=376 RepID=UPI002D29DADE|nr:OB-fold-containig protein [Bradyrhizobium sp.]HZR73338.1 OB-fold-containig protein [Bradyrhizobium sp.]